MERLVASATRDDKGGPAGVLASLALHATFAVLAVLLSFAGRPISTPDEGIAVDLISPDEFEASFRAAPKPAPQPPPATPDAPKAARPPGMIRATRLLSADALADPRSWQAREALPGLEDSERMVQLCNLEAMQQVHAWRRDLQPERVIAYASADVRVAGEAVEANGAALAGNGAWYRLRFRCGLSARHDAVTSFEFALGDPLPEADWTALNLPPPDADPDEPEEPNAPGLAGSADAAHIGLPINN